MEIHIKNATKKLKETVVLNDITLSLDNKNRYGLTGQNGSGKTMLLRSICGFLKLDSGEVYIDENKIGSPNYEFIHDAGVIVGEMDFYHSLSGLDNLRLLAEIRQEIGDDEIFDVLDKVGLYEARHKKYGKYSMGMKQRLRIAQAIMENPQVLILDEPFNGLDKNGTAVIQKVIDDFITPEKLLILTSHHESDIANLCNVIIEMDRGEIIDEKNI